MKRLIDAARPFQVVMRMGPQTIQPRGERKKPALRAVPDHVEEDDGQEPDDAAE